MKLVRGSTDGVGHLSPERTGKFARLVRLESEAARLRAELGLDTRISAAEPLDAEAAWSLIAGLASDFLSVHAADGTYVFASQACERLFGHAPSSLIGRSAYDFIHPEDIERVARDHATHTEPDTRGSIEYRMRRADGTYVWVETRADAQRQDGDVRELVCVTREVTERHEASEAQRALISELERRMEQVRQLSGLLPICAWCKSIRDDDGYWHQLEAYFLRSAHLEFTHGACPSCAASLRER